MFSTSSARFFSAFFCLAVNPSTGPFDASVKYPSCQSTWQHGMLYDYLKEYILYESGRGKRTYSTKSNRDLMFAGQSPDATTFFVDSGEDSTLTYHLQ